MSLPENLKYTKDHEWIKLDGNQATVGITEYAQSELGDVVFLEVETIGEHLNANDTFGTIEAVKTVSDLYLPVAGKIDELNSALEDQPELINTDPFGDGWIIKMTIDNPDDVAALLSAADYEKIIS